MVLSVTDLACRRGGLRVLEGLSFSLEAGEALILRGPNGSGKTTLLRTLAGLQPPDKGRIEADPETLAYAGHADGLKATLTVVENLTFWASLFGTRHIDQALSAFALEPLRDRPAQNLSAGQKRRLGLARLAVTGRPVWLLDEPTVSLDTHAVGQFGDLVRTHLGSGGAALIATHIELGLKARTLDLGGYRPAAETEFGDPFGEAFT